MMSAEGRERRERERGGGRGGTDLPTALEEVAGEGEVDDAGAVVENETALSEVGGGDQNALQPGALEEDAAECEGVLRRRFFGVPQLPAHHLQRR